MTLCWCPKGLLFRVETALPRAATLFWHCSSLTFGLVCEGIASMCNTMTNKEKYCLWHVSEHPICSSGQSPFFSARLHVHVNTVKKHFFVVRRVRARVVKRVRLNPARWGGRGADAVRAIKLWVDFYAGGQMGNPWSLRTYHDGETRKGSNMWLTHIHEYIISTPHESGRFTSCGISSYVLFYRYMFSPSQFRVL